MDVSVTPLSSLPKTNESILNKQNTTNKKEALHNMEMLTFKC